MAIVRPKSYSIRKITDNNQKNGQMVNPYRYPDGHGGFTGASKWGGNKEFHVEPPTRMKTGEKVGKGRD